MRVLYVNHTGQVSGGERSLLELVRGASGSFEPMVACPDGPLVDELAEIGVPRVRIPGIEASLKLHPRHTTAAVTGIARGAAAVRAVARRHRVSVVHANSIRAGLLATAARGRKAPPTVVHLRDRLPDSLVSTLTLRAIGRADLLIANSRYTADGLEQAGVMRTIRVIGNPVDLERFNPDKIDRYAARSWFGLDDEDYVSTVLAQITPWKGQEDAIRALARVRERHPNAKLLLVGSAKFISKATRYDNRSYLESLHRLVAELGLRDHVRFVGECDDVPFLLRATDTLLIPSWEEPFGRSMIEAMAMRVPVIATTVGGPAEVITELRDGLLVPPRKPELWARAITQLIDSPALRVRLARNGRIRARSFSVEAHLDELRSVYVHVIGSRDLSRSDLSTPAVPVVAVPEVLPVTARVNVA